MKTGGMREKAEKIRVMVSAPGRWLYSMTGSQKYSH